VISLNLCPLEVRLVEFEVRPCELDEANDFVRVLHRHSDPVKGHRFSLKATERGGGTDSRRSHLRARSIEGLPAVEGTRGVARGY
jgi:hypothetical protein